MASITLGGNPVHTTGSLPEKGTQAPDFKLVRSDLSEASLGDYQGNSLILNIFPSVDTGVCASSVRKFNEEAAQLEGVQVLCISRDLPFAQARFCGAEGIERVEMLSDFKSGAFGEEYGVTIEEGPFAGLHSRAVVILDEEGKVIYTEQVPEIGQEPNYQQALAQLS
ncbi:thiol peroxidase [Croceiramulus getboli]|nr:thiol peroxidase [Flavobacteriaceae bacterium YJPT1-3]